MSELATTHLSAAVSLEIEELRQRGGPNESDRAWARECMDRMRHTGGGHGIQYYDKGITAQEMSYLTQALAVLAFVDGGVRFAGLHFDAQHTTFGLKLDDALFEALEPFRDAMDRIEQQSRRLEDVSDAERARLKELEVLCVRAADAGDTTQQALLEAEMNAILLKPQPVVVEPIQAVQQALWESA